MPKLPDPAGFAKAILLEAADIPADMTIAQWREHKQASRTQPPRRARRRRRRERLSRAA
jgi:hypothetical protein